MFKRLLLILPLLLLAPHAEAQVSQARVVASCGSKSYTAAYTGEVTQDVTGVLCTTAGGGGGGGGTTTKANASDPTLVEGTTTNLLSVDLSGYLRTLAKQSGSWTVGVNNFPSVQTVSGSVALGGTLPAFASTPTFNLGTIGSASTAANQTSANTKLDSIITNTAAATPAGENHIGAVGGHSFHLSPTITVQNAAYSAGNSLGGLITITGAARTNGGTGTLVNLRLASVGGATNTVWVYAWSKAPTSTCTDKSAFVKANADNAYALPGFPQSVTLASPGSWDSTSYASVTGANAPFKNQDTSPGTAIYACLVTAGAVTPSTTADESMVLDGFQD